MAPLLALGPTLVPTIWQLPPRPMRGLARPALDLLLELLRAAVPLGEEAAAVGARAAAGARRLAAGRSWSRCAAPISGCRRASRDALLGQIVHRRIADMRETAARLATPPPAGSRADATRLLRLVADLDALEASGR